MKEIFSSFRIGPWIVPEKWYGIAECIHSVCTEKAGLNIGYDATDKDKTVWEGLFEA